MNEDGFASAIVLALLALAALLCLAVADAANVLVARARAQSAADAAALAAAVAQWPFASRDETPQEAAERMATSNGARLESCACALRDDSATVTVSVPTRIRMLGVAPSSVSASATSSLDVRRVFAPP
ncbi:MAG TPA: Rv3654c family TadE-like protein [Actinomycetota bacterium]|nr:Rv3654c family TadE-like protein [Actinomycetota bacterium]